MRSSRILLILGIVPALAAVAGLTFMLSGSPPAQADTSVCSKLGCAASAPFRSYGEHLKICDNAADGRSAVVQWYVNGRFHTALNSSGHGTCRDINLDLAEGTTIKYWACLQDRSAGGSIADCSGLRTDKA
jgi:hypothetical protein